MPILLVRDSGIAFRSNSAGLTKRIILLRNCRGMRGIHGQTPFRDSRSRAPSSELWSTAGKCAHSLARRLSCSSQTVEHTRRKYSRRSLLSSCGKQVWLPRNLTRFLKRHFFVSSQGRCLREGLEQESSAFTEADLKCFRSTTLNDAESFTAARV